MCDRVHLETTYVHILFYYSEKFRKHCNVRMFSIVFSKTRLGFVVVVVGVETCRDKKNVRKWWKEETDNDI